jgi:hypothetical protein
MKAHGIKSLLLPNFHTHPIFVCIANGKLHEQHGALDDLGVRIFPFKIVSGINDSKATSARSIVTCGLEHSFETSLVILRIPNLGLDTHRLRINFFSFAGSVLVSGHEQLLL